MTTLTAAALPATAAEMALRILVIGYGNPGRQDDGLGPAVAAAIEKLAVPNVSVIDNYQLTIEDAIDVAAHDIVWFVDATREGGEPCAVKKLRPAFDITFTSHLLKPETLLAIVERQFRRRPEAYLMSVGGYEFDFAEGLSERAGHNLAVAVELLRRRISEPPESTP